MMQPFILILAQEDAPPAPPSSAPAPSGTATPTVQQTPSGDGPIEPAPQSQGTPPFFFIVIAALIIMVVFSMSGQRREKKKREQMLTALKKGDRIQTIGGIIGSVAEVRDDYVLVKVDENANTKVKLARSAVQTVLGPAGSDD